MKILKIIGGILALLFLIFLLAGLVVPRVTYQTNITVDKPLTETFTLFNDIDQLDKWIPEVKKIEVIKETPDKVGSQYKMTVVNEGNEVEMTETVTGYEENKLVSLEFDAGSMHKTDTYHFTSDGTTTTISADHVCEGTNYMMKCVFAFFKGMFRNIDQTYLDNFKKVAEG